VTSISPPFGTTAGGTAVTITGSGFTNASYVKFYGVQASFTVVNDTTITAVSPPNGPGNVHVMVYTPGGATTQNPANLFTYENAPVVNDLSGGALPGGPIGGGNTVVISGTGFLYATGVSFGGVPATNYTVNGYYSITATAPAGAGPGMVDVTVTTPLGTSVTNSNDKYVYTAAPAVSGIGPSSGVMGGGTTVTISGSGFTYATAVRFSGVAAESFQVLNDGLITAVSPPGGSGSVHVTVTDPAGTSPTGPWDHFTYYAPIPVVTGVSPANGMPSGGTAVTVTGSGFTGATQVNFGGTAVTSGITVNSDSSLTVASPAGSGVVDVTVTTAGGTSGTSPADRFAYQGPPAVTSVSPTSEASTCGGLVTITGSAFTGASAVNFGGAGALTYTVVNDSTITVEPPAGSGTVDVTVTTGVGTSPTTAADQYTYLSGSAAAWGDNTYGELGNGGTTDGTSPAVVPGLPAVSQMAGDGASTLALTTAGNVYAWGDNASGELGVGSSDPAGSATPVEVEGAGGAGVLSNVCQVAGGAASSYALEANGTVYAWGNNTNGELGTGDNTNYTVPTPVTGLPDIVAIAAHGDWAMALSATGNVYAWGDNAEGGLGNNSFVNSKVPVEVHGVNNTGYLSGITQIAEGAYTAYALTGSGQVLAWGANDSGELGNGSTAASSAVPVYVNGLTAIVQIAGGLFHGLAVTSTGEVYGWGDNAFGELGTAPTSVPQRTAALVPGLFNVTQVAAGFDYSMAVGPGGSLYTWGYNADGELGDGSLNPQSPPGPALVTGVPPVEGIAGGWSQSLAVLS